MLFLCVNESKRYLASSFLPPSPEKPSSEPTSPTNHRTSFTHWLLSGRISLAHSGSGLASGFHEKMGMELQNESSVLPPAGEGKILALGRGHDRTPRRNLSYVFEHYNNELLCGASQETCRFIRHVTRFPLKRWGHSGRFKKEHSQ